MSLSPPAYVVADAAHESDLSKPLYHGVIRYVLGDEVTAEEQKRCVSVCVRVLSWICSRFSLLLSLYRSN